jgi:hypothetical protein
MGMKAYKVVPPKPLTLTQQNFANHPNHPEKSKIMDSCENHSSQPKSYADSYKLNCTKNKIPSGLAWVVLRACPLSH